MAKQEKKTVTGRVLHDPVKDKLRPMFPLDLAKCHTIDELVRAGAPIDAFGVGTRMGVSADHPYLDTAYKLVSYAGRPVMKLSRGKMSAPGRKQVFRRSKPFGDLVGLHDERPPAGLEKVLEPVMLGGSRTGARASIDDIRARFKADLDHLPAGARAIQSPKPPAARFTDRLRQLTEKTRRRLASQGLRT